MGNALAKFLEYGTDSVSSCIDGETKHIRNLDVNLGALDHGLAGLIALSENVLQKVSKAEENSRMQRTGVVKLWFKNVKHVESKVAELLKERDQEIDKLCLLGFCSKDMKSSHLFGREVYKLLKEVTTLKGQGEAFKEVTEEVTAPALHRLKTGSKVHFRTQKSDVCSKMEADKVQVNCLSSNEAWELFQTKVGKVTLDSDFRIREFAKEVVNECDHLPLALITICEALASKGECSEWEKAIKDLRISAAVFEDVKKKVFSLLKFSYDHLPNDTIRSCFLYCSLFPKDYNISKRDLIDYWISEGFLDEHESGDDIIKNLLHASLLEVEDDDSVKMHDVIRDMALWITCDSEKEKENCLVEAGIGLTRATDVAKWKGIKRLSLMNNQIKNLPKVGTHLDLQTLFLNNNYFVVIPSDFFKYTPFLKVLDLSNISLQQLPSGISNLVSLQHLDLSYTRVNELPQELSALVNLKCLNLEEAIELCTIPQNLISEFKQLQVFRLINCCLVGLAREASVLSGDYELLIEELCGLKCLQALSIELKSSHALHRFLTSQNLMICTQTLYFREFRDSAPVDILFLKAMKNLCELYMYGCHFEELKIDYAGIVNIETHGFHNVQTVRIIDCKNLHDLTWLILAPNLKTIDIDGCDAVEEIISSEKLSEVQKSMGILNPLAKLKRLDLWKLPSLKKIYQKALPLPHLNHLTVYDCPNLKELPLNCNSATDQIVIEGEEDWWKKLQWEDEATKDVFLPYFNPWKD